MLWDLPGRRDLTAKPRERPRGRLPHERRVVLQRRRERGDVVRRVPTLPNATAALRASPRRLARFIGEPLNAALNSACDMASSSRASVRASLTPITSRGANGDSLGSSAENRTFQGHTSWEEWRYNHFRIPLGTGCRTVRGEGD